MQQTEGTRMSAEDRRELERNIKELEAKIENTRQEHLKLWGHTNFALDIDVWNNELRRLRRMRQ